MLLINVPNIVCHRIDRWSPLIPRSVTHSERVLYRQAGVGAGGVGAAPSLSPQDEGVPPHRHTQCLDPDQLSAAAASSRQGLGLNIASAATTASGMVQGGSQVQGAQGAQGGGETLIQPPVARLNI